MAVDPRTGITLLSTQQRYKEQLINEGFAHLGAIATGAVVSLSQTSPPNNPNLGEVYFVKPTASGAWSGFDNKLALKIEGGWSYFDIPLNHQIYSLQPQGQYRWDGTAWISVDSSGIAVSDEGVQLTASATSFNFTGAGVTTSSSSGNVTVNIPGGGSSGSTTAVKATTNTAQSIPSLTSTKINLNAVISGDAALFDSTNNRIIINEAGHYIVGATVAAANPSSSNQLTVKIRKNGASILTENGSNTSVVTVAGSANLVSGDYLELLLFHNVGSAINTNIDPTGDEAFPVLWVYRSTGSAGRETLTANRTYYVSTTGSDSNNGLTAGMPFLTIQKAIDVVASLDINIYDVTIQLADGTYTGQVILKSLLSNGGTCTIVGNVSNRNTVIITSNVQQSGTILVDNVNTIYKFLSLTLRNTALESQESRCIFVTNSTLLVGDIDYSTCGTYHIVINKGGELRVVSPCFISSGAFMHAIGTGYYNFIFSNLTFVGSLSFNTFVASAVGGFFDFYGSTITGSFTGKRYDVSGNAVIRSNGGSVNYFPGSTAGSSTFGGQYL
ncbi:MAG: DUF2793 domain-containing protein [Xenococcaceae cyanobacterium]